MSELQHHHRFNKVDLHCHSHFSDGVLSPQALIEKALDAKIDLLALTDHDTLAGSKHLRQAARNHPITVIDGVELSVRWKLHDIHVLGLNVNVDSPDLMALLARQNQQRTARAQQMADLLFITGVEKAYQKACELAGHDRIGRPHLAQVLINEGVVADMKTAFKRYLTRGALAYVPTVWVNVDDAVAGIRQSGGLAVVAHPLKYKLTRSKLNALITVFKDAGGSGIEVVSGESTVSDIGELAGLCTRYDLSGSTGSDYHSDTYSRIKLGQQRPLPLNCKPIWEHWI